MTLSVEDLNARFPEFNFDASRNPLAKGGSTYGQHIVRNLQTTWCILESSDAIDSSLIYNLAQAGIYDRHLPFTEKRLSAVRELPAADFLEVQDVFLSVSFAPREHRVLDSSNTVPFAAVRNSPVRTGAFGEVRQVQETLTSPRQTIVYAKKTVKLDHNADRRELQLREYRILAHLPESPHVVQLRASYIKDGFLNMILLPWAKTDMQSFIEEYDGMDFWKQMQQDIAATNQFFGNIFACLAAGLHTIHSRNFKHKDLKPANVLLYLDQATGSMLPAITDFGISKKFRGTSKSVTFSGTDHYRPPERHVGRAGDIFALGCIYLEVAILKCGENRRRLNREVKEGYADGVARNMAAILALFPKDTPWWAAFGNLVQQMVAVDPSGRPSALEVLRAVDQMERAAGRTAHCCAASFEGEGESRSLVSDDSTGDEESSSDSDDDGIVRIRYE